jgi:hypothetical protein
VGSGFTVQIPYDQLMLLVMGLFMFVGATRGWYREFWTSVVLLCLTGLLLKPSLAAPIVEYLAKALRLIIAFVQGGFSLDLTRLAARVAKVEIPFGGDNPYLLLIIILLGFVLVSYNTRGDTKDVTAMSRLLGGLIGLFNGFVVLTLFKEYVIKYIRERTPQLAAASSPSSVAVALGDVPGGGVLQGASLQVLLVVGAAMLAVLIGSLLFGQSLGKR